MLRRSIRVLLVFVIAVGLTMPAGVRAMPMLGGTMSMRTVQVVDRPCHHCPQSQQPGSTSSDKMPACQAFACVSAPAVLPAPMPLPRRASRGSAYMSVATARLAGAEPAPDPFPPRSIVLL